MVWDVGCRRAARTRAPTRHPTLFTFNGTAFLLPRSHRRKRAAVINFLEQFITIVNLAAFVTANAIVIQGECQVTSPAVIWTGFVQCVVDLYSGRWRQGEGGATD